MRIDMIHLSRFVFFGVLYFIGMIVGFSVAISGDHPIIVFLNFLIFLINGFCLFIIIESIHWLRETRE